MWAAKQKARVALLVMLILAVVVSGCGKSNEVIATYEGGEITRGQFDSFLGAMQFINQDATQFDDPEFQKDMLNQFIAIKLISAEADDDLRKTEAKAANEEFTLMKEQFIQMYTQREWRELLKQFNTTEKEIKSFLETSRLVGQVLDESIEEADIVEMYEELSEKNFFDKIVISHILVAIDEVTDEGVEVIRTMDEALQIAEDIIVKLDEGEDFAQLAATFSDDPASAEEGGVLPEMNGAQLATFFGQAVTELPVGEISEPIAMEYGYHVIRVDSKETQQLDDLNEDEKRQLRGHIVSTRFMTFLENDLPAKVKEINL